LIQGIELSFTKRYQIEAIYPHLYVHDTPAGDFTVALKQGVTTIFSKTFDTADIKASLPTTDDFVHVYYPVIPDSVIYVDGGEFTIELTQSGYTFSESNYLGWCREFEPQSFKSDQADFIDSTNGLQLRIKIKDIP